MYLFFDCETTGLPKNWRAPIGDLDNWPRAIQIAWSLFDQSGQSMETAAPPWSLFDQSGQSMETAAPLIRPEGFVIPEDVQRIHGITTERALAEGKKLLDVLNEFAFAVEKSEVLIGHNVKFDENIISAEYLRSNLKPPFSAKKRFCTMEQTTDICKIPGMRGYKWPTLSQLYREVFKSNFEDAHDAGADVAACAKCFFELKRRGQISL
jgi:DNA polymerase III subunit epsilon